MVIHVFNVLEPKNCLCVPDQKLYNFLNILQVKLKFSEYI